MKEIGIELVSERCKECPRLELETAWIGSHMRHRCMHLQFCRQVLGFWKDQNRINEVELVQKVEKRIEVIK